MSNLDDIVFANRHRAYGAYALRQGYRSTLGRAVLLGSALFLGTLLLPQLYALAIPDRSENMRAIELQSFKPEAPPEKPIVTTPQAEPTPTATIRNPVPVVVADAPDDVPDVATVEELETATSGQTTQEGNGDIEVIEAPETAPATRTEVALETPEPEAEKEFVTVEQMPDFPGGMVALGAYLQKNLRYPDAAVRANVEGRVFVSFTVNTDGSLTDMQVLKGLGFGTDEEALRVLKTMPKWKPGRQSGRAVRVKFNLPVVFTLE